MTLAKQKGFSLVELLIVVTVIGILAGIAIPNLLASKRAANEASTLASLRTIHSCEAAYFATVGNGEYADLPTLAIHTLTDQILGSGTKSGYSFEIHPTAPGIRPGQFFTTAIPVTPSGLAQSGKRRFGMTEDGILHGDTTLTAQYADHGEVESAPTLGN